MSIARIKLIQTTLGTPRVITLATYRRQTSSIRVELIVPVLAMTDILEMFGRVLAAC